MSFAPSGPEPADSLLAVLQAREARAERQQALLAQYAAPLISFTLNIPGPMKNSVAYLHAHDAGLRALHQALQQSGYQVLHEEARESVAGREAFLVVAGGVATAQKRLCISLEDQHPLGRLFDFDVLTSDGEAVHRETVGSVSRTCLICNELAHACARSRRHSLSELLAVIERLIANYR